MDLKEIWRKTVDLIRLGQDRGPIATSCVYDNEVLGPICCCECLEELIVCWFLKKDSAP
jgi:hypothetical protein